LAKLRTVRQVLSSVKRRLKDRGIDTYNLDAELLLAKVLKCKRIDLYLNMERPLSQAELEKYRDLVELRSKYYPIAYIMGEKEFMSLNFYLQKGVFIPRPDSESLVEAITENLDFSRASNLKVADVCAGTGCLGISSVYYLQKKGIKVSRIDFYEKNEIASQVIELNIKENLADFKLESNIYTTDVLRENLKAEYDLIISNPPYISIEEMETLSPEVKEYHFKESLTDEKDGLSFYSFFAANYDEFLSVGGYLVLEIGYSQFADVKLIFDNVSKWEFVDKIVDLGSRDRGIIWKKI
jgi:release factor glutamine methyltransferase